MKISTTRTRTHSPTPSRNLQELPAPIVRPARHTLGMPCARTWLAQAYCCSVCWSATGPTICGVRGVRRNCRMTYSRPAIRPISRPVSQQPAASRPEHWTLPRTSATPFAIAEICVGRSPAPSPCHACPASSSWVGQARQARRLVTARRPSSSRGSSPGSGENPQRPSAGFTAASIRLTRKKLAGPHRTFFRPHPRLILSGRLLACA